MYRHIHIIQQQRGIVAQFNSKVTIARPRSSSLRTTIPEAIVKLLELEPGNEVIWTVNARAKKLEVSIEKA
jgi:hypothetical protein